ncbi:MAG: hypothetical protein ACRDIV_21080 [Ktedonobacteraceae bacterium]
MPFNTLLLSCLHHGTSASENNVSVSVKPQNGETVLFFHTDTDVACRDLQIQRGEPVCDYLVFYKKEARTVICLLELKGNNTDHAIEQIFSTCEHLKIRLSEDLRGKAGWLHFQQVEWKAYICTGVNSAISPSKAYAKKIEKAFRSTKNFKITHSDELGDFLRK